MSGAIFKVGYLRYHAPGPPTCKNGHINLDTLFVALESRCGSHFAGNVIVDVFCDHNVFEKFTGCPTKIKNYFFEEYIVRTIAASM